MECPTQFYNTGLLHILLSSSNWNTARWIPPTTRLIDADANLSPGGYCGGHSSAGNAQHG